MKILYKYITIYQCSFSILNSNPPEHVISIIDISQNLFFLQRLNSGLCFCMQFLLVDFLNVLYVNTWMFFWKYTLVVIYVSQNQSERHFSLHSRGGEGSGTALLHIVLHVHVVKRRCQAKIRFYTFCARDTEEVGFQRFSPLNM